MTETTIMSDDELVAHLQENAARALGHYETEIAAAQARAINYYHGRMDDLAAQDGRSAVVDGTVAITVDNFVANIIRPFVSADEIVRFEPRTAEDVAQAEQATEYVNYVLHSDNPGFMILHDWAKDAGMAKLGIVKIWWEDLTDRRPRLIENMDAAQVEMLGDEIVGGPWSDAETGLFSAWVVRPWPDGRVRIENVPPEEYLVSPYARPGRVPPYEAHRTRKARSELIEMGFDAELVDALPRYQGEHDDERSLARYRDEQYDGMRADAPGDRSRDMIEVHHEFVLIDQDGDGVSEQREIVRCGDVILYNEEVDHGPFARFCPIPMPHKLYGGCPADQVADDQKVKTALLRQQLDNLYLSNNPRPVLPEGSQRSDGSTEDTLADSAPGAAILEGRVPIRFEAVPFVADKVYAMQDYIDREIERKTGVAKQGQSLDREALNVGRQITATQATLMEDARNLRIETMARIFAETGISDMFRIILKLLVKHQPRARVIRLRNQWVSMDPRGWNADMDLSIAVGLGMGNRQDQGVQAQGILSLMERIGQTPFGGMVTEANVFNAARRAFGALGIRNADDYVTAPEPAIDPDTGAPQAKPELPDPAALKVQHEAMLQQQRLQAEQAEAAARLQTQRDESAAKIALRREEAAAEIALAREKAATEFALEQERIERAALLQEKAALTRNRAGGSLAV